MCCSQNVERDKAVGLTAGSPAAASRVLSAALCRLLTVVHITNGIEAELSNAEAMHQSPELSFPGPGAAQCSKIQYGQDQTQLCCACVPHQ